MRKHTKKMRCTAWILLVVLVLELVNPSISRGLTSGPSQPEVQSFEPVGTSDMVDMFSGDFVYNIPLMDVEGYPINIAYHGGVTMEQEASWVGLGWNINPGEINRSVRGLPDDLNGQKIKKELHLKDESTFRVGLSVNFEALGTDQAERDDTDGQSSRLVNVSANAGVAVTFNNYKGVGVDFDLGANVKVFKVVGAGLNIGVGSQTGADIDYNLAITSPSSRVFTVEQSYGGSLGATYGHGYSSRTGIKDRQFGVYANFDCLAGKPFGSYNNGNKNVPGRFDPSVKVSATANVPIGVKNFVPVITNSTTMSSIMGRIKAGFELDWCLLYGNINGMYSNVHFNNDGTRNAFGYLYYQNADNIAPNHTGILDFTRDKDGMFNKSMQYLPPANMSYDIYSVSGQGTEGVFRPMRNDFGSVYDPSTTSFSSTHSIGLEAGLTPNIFELGADYTYTTTDISSGPWKDSRYLRNFQKRQSGSIYEDVYFKQGGELSSVNTSYFDSIGGYNAVDPVINSTPKRKPKSLQQRDPRGNLIYYFTAEEASINGVGSNPNLVNYISTNGFEDGPNVAVNNISRVGSTDYERTKDQISEIVQIQKDGRKYVYGLPVINHIQREATFAVVPPSATDKAAGLATYTPGTDDNVTNGNGLDNYYGSSITPSYAHSYLLTNVLSADYVDVTGDGISDDDLGTYTKLNYSRKETDYRWRGPFEHGKAQYSAGFLSDPNDDKGSYTIGSREEWLLHSVETRNYVAEFYTSERQDACGSKDPISSAGSDISTAMYSSSLASPAKSYKLDSIKLYNKHDRFINGVSATPVKTVYFTYNYSLCAGIPNTLSSGSGKLTLDKIYFKYGNSEKSMLSPYHFSYGFNPNYDQAAKDKWGNYKPNNGVLTNYEFPFVTQNDSLNDSYAAAWSLAEIDLPSGGVIKANYESDDYAYVQDKYAGEMFLIDGIGNSKLFSSGGDLYANKKSPNLYFYFKRRPSMEKPGLSFKDNYLKGEDIVYYNFMVKLVSGKDSYEPIKGYAKVIDIGQSDNDHGYIQVEGVVPRGSNGNLNPVTYTSINTGRYNLPQIMYPGSAPHTSFAEALTALGNSFTELGTLFRNPLIRFVNKGAAKVVKLDHSYVRLQSPGLKKKGGGHRVKSLLFYDSWAKMAGGNEYESTYGKQYDYTINDALYGRISSGVASYEPLFGGDENPLRKPVPYEVQSGSKWPPNDAVGLYQETPIGETLYPSGTVGYSKITVKSVHADVGKSSQGVSEYEYYTAKDYPIQFKYTAIGSELKYHFGLFMQQNKFTATQGYSLVFNNMHGKMKSVTNYVNKNNSGVLQKISSQHYFYKSNGNVLDNNVPCLVYNSSLGQMAKEYRQLGVESDVTIDTRQREELTRTRNLSLNLNVSTIAAFLVIPIPYSFIFPGRYRNDFYSATVTKIIQQYGIIEKVVSDNEGAITEQTNEIFDPVTGEVLVSSINDEFNDRQHSVNKPAYWGYSGMGPAYQNIKFEDDFDKVRIDSNRIGRITLNNNYLAVGDELLINFQDSATGINYQNIVWFMGSGYNGPAGSDKTGRCYGTILPRFPLNTPGWDTGNILQNVHIKVIRSGYKNQLMDNIENYVTMGNPINDMGWLKNHNDSLVSLSARTYCDSNTRILRRYLNNRDTINPYATGERGLYRLLSEYAYKKNRNYDGLKTRYAGLFSADNFYKIHFTDGCSVFPYNYVAPYTSDVNWKLVRTITKWSPYGTEVENVDATNNYSTALFGYNEDLPVAVASNAKQGEILSEGFEDYKMLHVVGNIIDIRYSIFSPLFNLTLLPGSTNYNVFQLTNPTGVNIVSTAAHTGLYSLKIPNGTIAPTDVYPIALPINHLDYSVINSHYNSYFPYASYSYGDRNEYLTFNMNENKSYILSCWVRNVNYLGAMTNYALPDSCGVSINGVFKKLLGKTNIIEGWQKVEAVFNVPNGVANATMRLPSNYYIDDIRIFPSDANMKTFIYHPINQKLLATLDENNFSTRYEYDDEGNLIRVKKETEKGIMTVSESRSGHPTN